VSDYLRALFFPYSTLRLDSVLQAGASSLSFRVSSSGGSYSGVFYKGEQKLKSSYEQLSAHDFCESFLHHYYFRDPEKQYTATRKFFARLVLHKNKKPLEMEYSDQNYKFKFLAKVQGALREIIVIYSPTIGRLVVRSMRA